MDKEKSKKEKCEKQNEKQNTEIIEETITEAETEVIEEENQQKKYDEMERKYLLSLADFDNYRKRMLKENAAMRDYGTITVIEQFLPVIDNFERALSSAQNSDDPFVKGIAMIQKQLEGALDYLGVQTIKSVGQPFDPTVHNAVAHIEDEAYGQNEVIEELQKGYKYKDRIIRASTVKVVN
jgi:molecular chaperone GrpE